MVMKALNGKGVGGSSKIYSHSFSASDLTSGSVTFDSGIANPKMIFLYTTPSSQSTVYAWLYDIENNDARQSYGTNYEQTTEVVQNTIKGCFSFNGTNITYAGPSDKWKTATRIIVVG